jgi:hypothetical protein
VDDVRGERLSRRMEAAGPYVGRDSVKACFQEVTLAKHGMAAWESSFIINVPGGWVWIYTSTSAMENEAY